MHNCANIYQRGHILKKYIKSAFHSNFDTSDLKLEKERIADLLRPTAGRVLDKLFERTGFNGSVKKWYYRQDLNAVLLQIGVRYALNTSYLNKYTNPGNATLSNPAIISLEPSDIEIDKFVDNLEEALINRIQETFDSWTTLMGFDIDNKSVDESEYVIDKIVNEASCDKRRAAEFIRSLLDSRRVINKLNNYVAHDERGYYLIDDFGKEITHYNLYSHRDHS